MIHQVCPHRKQGRLRIHGSWFAPCSSSPGRRARPRCRPEPAPAASSRAGSPPCPRLRGVRGKIRQDRGAMAQSRRPESSKPGGLRHPRTINRADMATTAITQQARSTALQAGAASCHTCQAVTQLLRCAIAWPAPPRRRCDAHEVLPRVYVLRHATRYGAIISHVAVAL